MSDVTTVNLSIFDKTYQLKCPSNEAEKLEQAATHLDLKMREIHQAGNAIGFERTAMMAALDVCYELMNIREDKLNYGDEINQRLKGLTNRISHLLDDNHINLPARAVGEQTQLNV